MLRSLHPSEVGPVIFNVSTLLREPIGATRTFRLDGEPVRVPERDFSATADGTLELMMTTRGVLVHARLTVHRPLGCGRCLTTFEQQVELEFDEEFIVEIDVHTGERLDEISPDDFHVDDHQYLDLSEAVRQYEQATLPLRPICRPDCAGLCPICGQDLNQRTCDCPRDEDGHRWSSLQALGECLRAEEDDGRTKA